MNNETEIRLLKNRTLHKKILMIICGIAWGYAGATRFFGIIGLPNTEKARSLVICWLVSLPISILMIHYIYSQLTGKFLKKWIWLIVLVAAVVMVEFYQPPPFPEINQLEISPYNAGEHNWLEIVSINRVSVPSGKVNLVWPNEVEVVGDWEIAPNEYTLIWNGGSNSKITYTRLMQAGINILLRSGPDGGKAWVTWNGVVHPIDLYSLHEGIVTLQFEPPLNIRQADRTRQILIGGAVLGEISLLVAIIIVIYCLYLNTKQIRLRAAWPVVLMSVSLGLMQLVINQLNLSASFADPCLEIAVREKLNLPEGKIYKNQLRTIAELDASYRDIETIEGIEQLRNLVSLNLRRNFIRDVTPLKSLKRLHTLDLRENMIEDIQPLGNLTNMQHLNLRDNLIIDIEPLSGLKKLSYLNLHSNTRIESISPINHLVNLQTLILRNVPVIDQINVIAKMTKLSRLNLQNSGIRETFVIGELMAKGLLTSVDIYKNPIPQTTKDGYAPVRVYWEKVNQRSPFLLPAYTTLEPPSFSHSPGFYTKAFQLEIRTENPEANIHFTLDGSDPTRDSPIYKSPIIIASRSGEKALLANIPIRNGWREPDGEVFKANVVRAKIIHRKQDDESRTITGTFFVDPNMAERYHLPIMAISTDSENFFHKETGIYANRNYWERGSAWERPAHIEFFEKNGELGFMQNGGVRIHGGTSRDHPQKSLRLIAGHLYDPKDSFNYCFFADEEIGECGIQHFRTLILRNGGSDGKGTLMRDGLMQTLVDDIGLDTQSYRPVIVFINGEFWGIYNLRERQDGDYLKNHHEVNPEKLVIIGHQKVFYVAHGNQVDRYEYHKLLDYAKTEGGDDAQKIDEVQAKIDLDNFINYQIAQIYFGNVDWPHNNLKLWKTRSVEKSEKYNQPHENPDDTTKFRAMVFDTDIGFGLHPNRAYIDHNTLAYAIEHTNPDRRWSTILLKSLLKDDEFRVRFIEKFDDHLNFTFHPYRVNQKIDQLSNALLGDMPEHIRRWRTNNDSVDEWREKVDRLVDFANQRPAYLRKYLNEYFNMDGSISLTVNLNPDSGVVLINGNPIPENGQLTAEKKWEGLFFTGRTITIKAIAKPGYRFVQWEGYEPGLEEIIILLDEDVNLRVVFERIPNNTPPYTSKE